MWRSKEFTKEPNLNTAQREPQVFWRWENNTRHYTRRQRSSLALAHEPGSEHFNQNIQNLKFWLPREPDWKDIWMGTVTKTLESKTKLNRAHSNPEGGANNQKHKQTNKQNNKSKEEEMCRLIIWKIWTFSFSMDGNSICKALIAAITCDQGVLYLGKCTKHSGNGNKALI